MLLGSAEAVRRSWHTPLVLEFRLKRIERIVVQLLEAKRFADEGSEPHGRLALLLLDNLAEILIHREVEYQLAFASMFRSLREPAVSRRKEKKIRRYFGEKVAYLVELGLVEATHARMLDKLHLYRNEAYHHDEVRTQTLHTAVDIYFYLCCILMKSLPVHSYQATATSKHLKPFVDDARWVNGFEVQGRVADSLLVERRLNRAQINVLLRTHLRSRLSDMREMIEYWAGEFPALRTPADVLHHCQVPEDAIRTMEDLANIRSVAVPHDLESIHAWEQRADMIDKEMSVDQAFIAFAEIEDDFETLEEQVIKLSTEMDRAVQDEIDFLRGK